MIDRDADGILLDTKNSLVNTFLGRLCPGQEAAWRKRRRASGREVGVAAPGETPAPVSG